MNEHRQPESGNEPQAEAKLRAAFANLPRRRVAVPPRMDQAILGAARQQLQAAPATGWRARWRAWVQAVVRDWQSLHPQRLPVLRWTAFACLLALLAWVGSSLVDRQAAPGATVALADLNRDGQVDILDAFALARDLQGGRTTGADLNADGRVDRQDVDALAAQAVQLQPAPQR